MLKNHRRCCGLDAIAREEKMVCCPKLSAKIKSAMECQKVNKTASFEVKVFKVLLNWNFMEVYFQDIESWGPALCFHFSAAAAA